ncbi:MAG: flavodoxin family protein, partial [Candidatus Omnitrophota bacterium]
MMKVLAISASPRKGGNTETLIDRAIEGAFSEGADIEKIILDDLDIAPCSEEEYDNVTEEGLSVVSDDMALIFSKIRDCDALILGSPIFFGSVSAQAKIMIDRFQCVWVAKNIMRKNVFDKRKAGAFICVSATDREDFFENARSVVRHFFATVNIKSAGEA